MEGVFFVLIAAVSNIESFDSTAHLGYRPAPCAWTTTDWLTGLRRAGQSKSE